MIDLMKSRARLREDTATHQLECAQQVMSILFERTGLSTILREAPAVTVGAGNRISFTVQQSISRDVVLGPAASSGNLAFVPDLFNQRGKARTKTSSSLHLTNLGFDEILRGQISHAYEFLRKKTTLPSDLLNRLED